MTVDISSNYAWAVAAKDQMGKKVFRVVTIILGDGHIATCKQMGRESLNKKMSCSMDVITLLHIAKSRG